ncbi:MAG: hypothetical protein KH297_04755 [Firmicutes bacterium]|nr:hypothetical protein [Bacillota bacterium]
MDISNKQRVKVIHIKHVPKRKNICEVLISSYEGTDKQGRKKYSKWKCSFVGNAFIQAWRLREGDDIVLIRAKIERIFSKEMKKNYVNIIVYDFDKIERI